MQFSLNRNQKIYTAAFLLIELVLYGLILTTGGDVLVWSSFISIAVCFLYALTQIRTGDLFIIGGLACTLAADYFLVICSPIQQLNGMTCFLMAQALYAIRLHRENPNRVILLVRRGVTVAAIIAAALILRNKADPLAVISLCYYVNLIMNTISAFTQFKVNKLLPIGLILFLLCDTVIGLQMACGVYLPIPEDSLIYKIIFMDFHLSWFFYLPSQVIIALHSNAERGTKQ